MKTKEQILTYGKIYRKTHKQQRKVYLLKNNEKINKQKREWNQKFKEINGYSYFDRYKHKYYKVKNTKPRIKKTREELLSIRRKQDKYRIKNDSNFRLKRNFGTLIYLSLKADKAGRKWQNLVGFTLEELKVHLEKQFRMGMSWDNYGKIWQVDHILPCVYFDQTNPVEFKKCWSLNNLQPLFAVENMRKNSKLPNGIRFIRAQSSRIKT